MKTKNQNDQAPQEDPKPVLVQLTTITAEGPTTSHITEAEAEAIQKANLTSQEWAKANTDLTPKALRRHLRSNRIAGAMKLQNRWYIPNDAVLALPEKPEEVDEAPPEVEVPED